MIIWRLRRTKGECFEYHKQTCLLATYALSSLRGLFKILKIRNSSFTDSLHAIFTCSYPLKFGVEWENNKTLGTKTLALEVITHRCYILHWIQISCMRFGSHKGCLELCSCCKSNDLKRYWTCQKRVNRVRYRLRKTGGFSSKMRLGFLIWNGKDARTVVRRKVSVYEHSMLIFLLSNV